jgi:hypothetical protein
MSTGTLGASPNRLDFSLWLLLGGRVVTKVLATKFRKKRRYYLNIFRETCEILRDFAKFLRNFTERPFGKIS